MRVLSRFALHAVAAAFLFFPEVAFASPGARSFSSARVTPSGGVGRQGIALKHGEFLTKKSLCPVVLCPYLCNSDLQSDACKI